MDRDRLARWLESPHRTFRWNDGDSQEAYEAVESTDQGLRWYRWSHSPAEGGCRDEALQTYDELERDGPARPLPPRVLEELRAHVARLRSA